MGEFLIVVAVSLLVFGVLLAVLHRRAQNGQEPRPVLGACSRGACRCRREQRPSDDERSA